jgi:hypothetical protein
VLDHIRHVDLAPVDPSLLQRPVEELSGRPDERVPFDVLAVPGLLADQHQLGSGRTFAEDGLGGVPPQATGLAAAGGVGYCAKRRSLGDELPGGAVLGSPRQEGGLLGPVHPLEVPQ